MKKISDSNAETIESYLQECLDYIEALKRDYGDGCRMNTQTAQRITEILESINTFVLNSYL